MKKYLGRSFIAKNKIRFKGRFVKAGTILKKSFFKVQQAKKKYIKKCAKIF
jgi:hypothetical protein